jgi:hypothetical protein
MVYWPLDETEAVQMATIFCALVLPDHWRGYCGQATVVVVFLSGVQSVWLGRSPDFGPSSGRGDFKSHSIAFLPKVFAKRAVCAVGNADGGAGLI